MFLTHSNSNKTAKIQHKQSRFFFNIKFKLCMMFAQNFKSLCRFFHCFLSSLKNMLQMSPSPLEIDFDASDEVVNHGSDLFSGDSSGLPDD